MEAKCVAWKIRNNLGGEARRPWMVLPSMQLMAGMHKHRPSSHCLLALWLRVPLHSYDNPMKYAPAFQLCSIFPGSVSSAASQPFLVPSKNQIHELRGAGKSREERTGRGNAPSRSQCVHSWYAPHLKLRILRMLLFSPII